MSGETFGMNLSFRVGDDEVHVKENRRRFFESLQLDAWWIVVPLQCHSDSIRTATEGGEYPECDGLPTDRQDIALAVTVADCVPLFLYDPVRRVVGAIHSCWRGSASGITNNAVLKMVSDFGTDPPNILAYIGPSAGVCCYEVGDEVASRFEPRFLRRENGAIFLDLKSVLLEQLLKEGAVRDRIEVNPQCTICFAERFHSYRRDGKRSRRMMGIINLRKQG